MRADPSSKSMLLFFEVKDKSKDKGKGTGTEALGSGSVPGPVLQIAVEGGGVSAIMVKWQSETNQILCR